MEEENGDQDGTGNTNDATEVDMGDNERRVGEDDEDTGNGQDQDRILLDQSTMKIPGWSLETISYFVHDDDDLIFLHPPMMSGQTKGTCDRALTSSSR